MAKIVCLDAGWGGNQVGALGNGLKCKDINLKVTLMIGDILKKAGINVVYTRTTDVKTSLSNRVNIGNNSNADLYVVIHSNAYRSTAAKGFETYFYKSIDRAFADKVHASVISDSSLYSKNRGVKRNNFYVLRYTRMPACMPVLGFITNTTDANIIKNKMDVFAKKIAEAICGQLGVSPDPVPPPIPPPPPPPPTISSVTVSNTTVSGAFTLTYTAKAGSGTLTHRLKLNNGSYVNITPAKSGDVYTYSGTNLNEGSNSGQIEVKDGSGFAVSPSFNIIIPSDLTITTPSGITQYQGMPFTFTYSITGRNSDCRHEFSEDGGRTYVNLAPSKNGNQYSVTKIYNSMGTRSCKIRITNNASTVRETNAFTLNIREPLKGLSIVTSTDSYTMMIGNTLNVGYVSNRTINSAKLSIDNGETYPYTCAFSAIGIVLPIESLVMGQYSCKVKVTDGYNYTAISNSFTVKITGNLVNNVFESVELITDKNIKANEYTTVAIRLKAKKDAASGYTLNPKVKHANNFVIKNIQFEKGSVKTDWKKAIEDTDVAVDKAQEVASNAKKIADSAQTAATNAQTSATDALNKHTEISNDNKLTASEKQSAKLEWDIIVGEKPKIESEGTKFGVSLTNYQSKYNDLNSYITPLLSNLTTTSDIVGTTYRQKFKDYYDARQDVLNLITSKAKQLADNAQTSANSAQTAATNAQNTANTAQSNANTANNLLSDIANDNKLTSSEKKVTKLEWDVILNEKDKIVADANKYGQSTTDYVNKYNVLNTYITPILSNINVTSDIVGTTFRTNFANYYSSRQDLLNAISAKSKELSDNAQSAANTANSLAQSAQTTATAAQSAANTANSKHAELSNDNKLTAIEKHSTKKEWDTIIGEKPKIESEGTKFGVSLTTYQSKYNDLNTYITPLLANLDTTSDIVGTTYRQKFKDYYNARQDILNSITSKAKQLADNAQTSANDANNKANQLTEWKKEAEQKITADAITNTVKSAVDVDGKQLFAKMADVKITAENMIATFSEVGGVNLLRNTEFKSHTNNVVDFWYPLRWDMSAGGNHSISVRPIGNTWALNNRRTLHGAVNDLPLSAKGKNLTVGFDSEYFEVQPNQVYTLGCLIAAHRTKDVTIEMLCFDADGNRLMGDNHACWIQDASNYSGGNDRKNWKKIIHRWTPQENASKCILRAFMGEYLGGENSALFWIAEPVVVKGNVDPIWTPSSDENYTGIVKSDKDGVEVEMKDGEGSQGRALLGYQGLEIFDGGGHRKAWFGNNDSAQIDKLRVGNISNRHIIKWAEDRPLEFYVAPNASGDGTGRDLNNKSNSINNTLNWIWNNYGVYSWRKDLNIFCEPGTYNEDIVISGWLGSGVIRIYFHPDSTWYGQHTIEDNTMAVYLLCRGTNDSMQWNNHGQMFRFRSSNGNSYMFRIRNTVAWIVGGRFCKEGWSGGFNEWYGYDSNFMLAYCGARVYVANNDVVGFYKYLEINDCSFVVTYQNRGHCYKFASVNYGGLLSGQGRVPMHSGGAESYNGGKWWDLGDVGGHNSMWQPKDTAPPPPPAPTYQWMEGSFGTSNLRTVPEGSGSGTTSRNGEWGQGKWGSYKPHRGYADLGNGPSDWCGGGDNYRNVTAWITLTRLGTSHGIAGATPRPRFKEPNGNFWDCGVGFGRGETKTIQLPSSIANAIANGSMRTLEMWAGTSSNDYSFYNNTGVKIRCEKKI